MSALASYIVPGSRFTIHGLRCKVHGDRSGFTIHGSKFSVEGLR